MKDLNSLVCVDDFRRASQSLLPKSIKGFYESGALMENTLKENEEAFNWWYIRPRLLIDVSNVDLSTTVLGHRISVPFGVAPTGMQGMCHPDGESGAARAAGKIGAVYGLSTSATTDLETVSKENGLKFFQLYVYSDKNITERLVRRAEKAGYKALVVTIDRPTTGIRYSDLWYNFSLPSHLRLANFDDANFPEKDTQKKGGLLRYISSNFSSSLTWEDISWLKSITRLPIVLKGVLTAEDAIKSLEVGAAAIWVSNHGGRQIDGTLPTMEALPEIVDAVGHACEIYVDGGVRTGADIFKALALGANMVFVGRPLAWGLTCGGYDGAYKVLQILENELKNTMCLSGCPTVKSITRDRVVRKMLSKL
ncbi:UNVERIFIED_CONTAM: hypothetical protein RMT77_013603 [Armadillidium vulgare]